MCCRLLHHFRGSFSILSFSFALALFPWQSAPGQEPSCPEIEKFASDITGTIWELRGTNSLKRLRYDGESFASLSRNGRAGSPYESAFVDVGVVRLNFPGANTGWYFFDDNLKYVTPTTASGEMMFNLAAGSKAKPVKSFPADIEGQVWDSVPDERKLIPMRLRWNGKELETGVKRGEVWDVTKHPFLLADRRIIETPGPDGGPTWFVFSADGKEAWMLHLESIFGGHAPSVRPKAARTPTATGLTPQLTDLTNFGEDLVATAEQTRLDTLRRHLQRVLKQQPALAATTAQRLGGK